MAAMVIQRGLREGGPGNNAAVMRLPSAGRMVLPGKRDAGYP